MELPKIGLYIATKKAKGMRLYVEAAHGDSSDESYLVEIDDDDSVGDDSAVGEDLDKELWEYLASECGLEYQGNNHSLSYFEFCKSPDIDSNPEDGTKEYGRGLEIVKIFKKLYAAEAGSDET
jgi:hypothetical protein